MTRTSHPDLEAAVDQTLAIVLDPKPLPEARLLELVHALDRLALAVHPIDPNGSTEDIPGEAVQPVTRKQIAARFPMLGLYAVLIPPDPNDSAEALVDPSSGIGDAIDDLLDIANDLCEAEWLRRNASRAAWVESVQFTFRTHWGRHLRDLQGHLHDMAF